MKEKLMELKAEIYDNLVLVQMHNNSISKIQLTIDKLTGEINELSNKFNSLQITETEEIKY